MTPAEIAAKLTPEQVRALRHPNWCKDKELLSLATFEARVSGDLITEHNWMPMFVRTPLGRAVLAVLDGDA